MTTLTDVSVPTSTGALTDDDVPEGSRVVAHAGGRLRIQVDWLKSSPGRAVAVEDAVTMISGVRAVHAYPRTASVVVWYSDADATWTRSWRPSPPGRARSGRAGCRIGRPVRPTSPTPTSLRMVIGGVALTLLGLRRYAFARPPMLGPTGRLFATGATIVTGYPFLRGALRTLRGGRASGTDALVSAATIASLVLRENVVALTVLWLLNIGEYLQDLTLRRTRRAISDLLRGNAGHRLGPAGRRRRGPGRHREPLQVGDEVIIHDHVAIPVDGVVARRAKRSSTSPRSPARPCPSASRQAPASTPVRWSSGAGSW